MRREQPQVPKAFGSSLLTPSLAITEAVEEAEQQHAAGGVEVSVPPGQEGYLSRQRSPLPLALGILIIVSITFPFTIISLVLLHCL